MPSKVVIVDYEAGNLHSVYRALERLGTTAAIASNGSDVAGADKVILPGVGHFGKAMSVLRTRNLEDSLNEAVLNKRRPVLGICLGMELMARHSEEGDSKGLGWFDADVVRFDVRNRSRYKVPHTGWNQISAKKTSRLTHGLTAESEFYFLHAYHMRLSDPADILAVSQYESPFVSAVERENIFGVQFHPEKSHDAGLQILKNFVDL